MAWVRIMALLRHGYLAGLGQTNLPGLQFPHLQERNTTYHPEVTVGIKMASRSSEIPYKKWPLTD